MNKNAKFSRQIQVGCGLDVHRSVIVASIYYQDSQETITKSFNAYTEDLEQLLQWLLENHVSHVAMESTGVYWKPVFNVLEDQLHIALVNARFIKNVPGKKTDKKDSEWIAQLLCNGLLHSSFVPPKYVRHLRDLSRYSKKLSQEIAKEKNRVHKQLQDANIKLSSVISDVFGVFGTEVLEQIAEGVIDTENLASHAGKRYDKKRQELEKALKGKVNEHHCFMIKHHLDKIDYLRKQQDLFLEKMDKIIVKFHNEEFIRLQTIPGVSQKIARGIVAEMGFDMSVFPTENHLASWVGICPGNNESAGKSYSGRARPGNKFLKCTLVEAAWAAVATKNSEFKERYFKMSLRMGKKKALFAIAHKLVKTVYVLLDRKENYKVAI